MNSLLISGFDKGCIADSYNKLEGCLYDNDTLQLDEVKGGNEFQLILGHSGNHEVLIQKIYLIGTKMLVLCKEGKEACNCLDTEDNEFTFDIQVGYVNPNSIDLITYVYNENKNEISDGKIHYITNEGMYLHRIILEQHLQKQSQWDWPWNWVWCKMA